MPLAPQPRTVTPRGPERFPVRALEERDLGAGVWWVGAHGGAGETTLEHLLEGSRAAGHAWPLSPPSAAPARVVLLARTNAHGLRAAQLAVTEWAAGIVPVQLDGLVLIADAPGRLPKALRDFAQLVAGGAPAVWRVPWVEAWRTGEPVCAEQAPRTIARMLTDLRNLPPHVPDSLTDLF